MTGIISRLLLHRLIEFIDLYIPAGTDNCVPVPHYFHAVCPACDYIHSQDTPIEWVPLCGRHFGYRVSMIVVSTKDVAKRVVKIISQDFLAYAKSIGAAA